MKTNEQESITPTTPQLRFSDKDIDFSYLCGVFNIGGINGLHKEIQRLIELDKDPHDIIDECREQLLVSLGHKKPNKA
jgi:hypothetical protein